MFEIISPSRSTFGGTTARCSNIRGIIAKKKGTIEGSGVQGFEPVLEHLAELKADLGIKGTDRADIVVRQILEFRTGPDAPVGFPALLVIDIVAEHTEVAGGVPFLKAPFPDPAFSPLPTDRAEVIVGEILKCRAGRNAVVGLAPQGGVDVATDPAFIPDNFRGLFFCR
jgi:hypothetical protein